MPLVGSYILKSNLTSYTVHWWTALMPFMSHLWENILTLFVGYIQLNHTYIHIQSICGLQQSYIGPICWKTQQLHTSHLWGPIYCPFVDCNNSYILNNYINPIDGVLYTFHLWTPITHICPICGKTQELHKTHLWGPIHLYPTYLLYKSICGLH